MWRPPSPCRKTPACIALIYYAHLVNKLELAGQSAKMAPIECFKPTLQGESVMSVINTQIKPFKAQAFKQGKFIEVTEADLKGKWAVFFFYPADFTFVCPTELGDLADNYA